MKNEIKEEKNGTKLKIVYSISQEDGTVNSKTFSDVQEITNMMVGMESLGGRWTFRLDDGIGKKEVLYTGDLHLDRESCGRMKIHSATLMMD